MSFSKYSDRIDIDTIIEIENDIITNKRLELIINEIGPDPDSLSKYIFELYELNVIFGKDYYVIDKLMINPSLKGIMDEVDSIKFLYTIDLKQILALFNFIGIKKNRGFVPIEDIVPDNLLGYEKISEWAKNEEYLYKKKFSESFNDEINNINITIQNEWPEGVQEQGKKIIDELLNYLKKMELYDIEYTRYDLIQNSGLEFIKFLCLMVEIVNYNWMLLNPQEGLDYLNHRQDLLSNTEINKYKLRKKNISGLAYIESNLRQHIAVNKFISSNKCENNTEQLIKILNNKINNMISTNKKCNKKKIATIMEKLREFGRQELFLEKQIKNHVKKISLYKDSNGLIIPDKMDDNTLEDYLDNVSKFEKEKKNLNNIALNLFKYVENI